MRESKEIRKWMIDADISVIDIARDLEVSHTLVCLTITGQKHNRKVLRYLVDKGCQVQFLALPADMKKAA